MTNNKQRDIWIDTLRGIAALGVMIAHLAVTFPNIGVKGSGTGKLFVSLFLCITGYYSFAGNNEKDWKAKGILSFYGKKIRIIIPQFLFCLLIGWGLGLYNLNDVWKTLTFQMGLKHFWYIPVVLGLYLIVPFISMIVTLFLKSMRVYVFAILIIGFEIVFPWFRSTENTIEFWWYISPMLIGSFIRELVDRDFKKSIVYDVGTMVCVCVLIIIVPGVRELVFNIPSDGYLQNKLVFMSLIWGSIIFCISKSKYIYKLINKPNILSRGAKYGYTLYLIHCLILDKLRMSGIYEWRLVLYTIVLSSVAAVIIYYMIQYPIDYMIKRIEKDGKRYV